VQNYGGRGYGSLSLRSATWYSSNTVYAQLVHELGPDLVAQTARRLGVASLDPARTYGISLALGSAEVSPLEMAGAYAVFANHGVLAPVTPVRRVLDAEGNVLEDNTVPLGAQVMDAAVADTVTDVMRGVVTEGTGTGAAIDRPVAGKTGTAEDYRAAWFVGYTPQLATAVWMGHSDEPRPLENIGGYASVTGGSLPASAWAQFMQAAHAGLPVLDFTPPGPLPLPPGTSAITPGARDYPSAPPLGCGGICPPPPPADDDEDDEDDEDAGDDDPDDGDGEDADESTGDADDDADDADDDEPTTDEGDGDG
jgi:penicillin-binding protein 1A